jgi:hypothetical protein
VTEPVENTPELPFAQGQHFATLDAYLAHLERRGATGVPWYREIAPGRYALVARRGPRAAAVEYSRTELAARFGFAE